MPESGLNELRGANAARRSPRRLAPRKQQPRIALFLRESKKDILLGVAKYVREFGPWRLYLQPTEHDVSMPQWLARWQGDGIIGRITDPAAAKLIRSTGLPLVDVLGVVRRPDIPLVHTDDAAVGRMAAEHLLERGFKHFGCYGPADAIWMQQRRSAFAQTVNESGVDCAHYEKHWTIEGPTGWDAAEEQLAAWLTTLPKPVGVFTANDQLGQRLLSAARRAGIHVPEELAVVGVDDDRATCEVCDPPLSSVQTDSEQQGYKAAELLDQLMAGEAPPPDPVLIQPPGVHTRQSSNILAIDDQGDGGGNGGTLRISVNEAPPPPTVEITVDPVGRVDAKAGVAYLTGTYTCTNADFIDVFGEARQTIGVRAAVVGFFEVFDVGTCDGTAHTWSAAVFPDNGKFAGGKTLTVTFAFACGTFECADGYVEQTVKLRGGKL